MSSLKDCVENLMRGIYFKEISKEQDPKICYNANTVRQFYRGFPHVVRWDPNFGNGWNLLYPIARDEALAWCKEHCSGEVSTHIHRVILSSSYSDREEWAFNELGGRDYCFWAFENEEDALMFSLRW